MAKFNLLCWSIRRVEIFVPRQRYGKKFLRILKIENFRKRKTKTEMKNKQMKINKRKKIINQKVGWWAVNCWLLKQRELLHWALDWAWVAGDWKKITVEKETCGLWRISGTLTGHLDDWTSSVSAQILRRCSTRRKEQFYDDWFWFNGQILRFMIDEPSPKTLIKCIFHWKKIIILVILS